MERYHELTGVWPWVYGNAWRFNQGTVNTNCGRWVAGYPSNGITDINYGLNNDCVYKVNNGLVCAWQFSSSVRISGYSGNLDGDVFYGDAAAWDKYAGGSPASGGSGGSTTTPSGSVLSLAVGVCRASTATAPLASRRSAPAMARCRISSTTSPRRRRRRWHRRFLPGSTATETPARRCSGLGTTRFRQSSTSAARSPSTRLPARSSAASGATATPASRSWRPRVTTTRPYRLVSTLCFSRGKGAVMVYGSSHQP